MKGGELPTCDGMFTPRSLPCVRPRVNHRPWAGAVKEHWQVAAGMPGWSPSGGAGQTYGGKSADVEYRYEASDFGVEIMRA